MLPVGDRVFATGVCKSCSLAQRPCLWKGLVRSVGVAQRRAGSGSDHNHVATAAQTIAGKPMNQPSNNQAFRAEPAIIDTVASHLTRRDTVRRTRQSCSGGPKRGWSSSQRSQRLQPREKDQAASNTKGTAAKGGRCRAPRARARAAPRSARPTCAPAPQTGGSHCLMRRL